MHIDDEEFENCDGPYAGDGEGWDVSNSTGFGTYDMYSGTQQSVNTFFAQLETQTGMCEPLQLAADMGVKVPLAQKVPSWILGVSDSSPLELAQAYATFAARGLHCDPRPVTEVLDSQGQPLKEFSTECEQVMPGATADAVNDILRGVMEPGGFGQNIAIDKPSAGKTGTNQQNMSVWFAGYTPTLATVAMVAGCQRVRRVGEPQRPDRGRQPHLRGLRIDRRRPDLGRRDGGGLGQAPLRGLPDASR